MDPKPLTTPSPKQSRSVNLTEQDWQIAEKIGAGNISMGVRIAVRTYAKHTNTLPEVPNENI